MAVSVSLSICPDATYVNSSRASSSRSPSSRSILAADCLPVDSSLSTCWARAQVQATLLAPAATRMAGRRKEDPRLHVIEDRIPKGIRIRRGFGKAGDSHPPCRRPGRRKPVRS